VTSGADLRLHLVRHGETLFNVRQQLQGWCDSPLTVRGRRQIAALGERMRGVPLTAAFTSDLLRTRETAAGALVGHPGLAATPLTDLREWSFGGWEGQPNPSLWEPLFARHGLAYGAEGAWDTVAAAGFEALVDAIADSDDLGMAEDAAQLWTRMRGAVASITDGAATGGAATGGGATGDVLVVTHGAYLQTLLPLLVPGTRLPPGFPNCGIATVRLGADGEAEFLGVDDSCSVVPEPAVTGGGRSTDVA